MWQQWLVRSDRVSCQVDRLTFSCVWELTADGEIVSTRFTKVRPANPRPLRPTFTPLAWQFFFLFPPTLTRAAPYLVALCNA